MEQKRKENCAGVLIEQENKALIYTNLRSFKNFASLHQIASNYKSFILSLGIRSISLA
jgi:hypothetical protein